MKNPRLLLAVLCSFLLRFPSGSEEWQPSKSAVHSFQWQ